MRGKLTSPRRKSQEQKHTEEMAKHLKLLEKLGIIFMK